MNATTVTLGRIDRPFGVMGWVHVTSFTDPRNNLTQYSQWFLHRQEQSKLYEVTAIKPHGESFVAKLVGIDDRDQAALLNQATIEISTNELPRLADGDYYWHQLIGLTVITTQQKILGKITEMIATGANDVLVIEGQKRHLIPYLDNVIIDINLQQQQMIVDWDWVDEK